MLTLAQYFEHNNFKPKLSDPSHITAKIQTWQTSQCHIVHISQPNFAVLLTLGRIRWL